MPWRDAADTATVRAVTEVSRAPSDEFRALAPYTLVIVQLDEGPRLMAHAASGVQIGSACALAFLSTTAVRWCAFDPMV